VPGFRTVIVDTSVMNLPATFVLPFANRIIKEKLGFPGRRVFERHAHVERGEDHLEPDGFKPWTPLSGHGSVSGSDFNFYVHRHGDAHLSGGGGGPYPALDAALHETKRISDKPDLPIKKYFASSWGKLTAGGRENDKPSPQRHRGTEETLDEQHEFSFSVSLCLCGRSLVCLLWILIKCKEEQ